MTDKRKRRHAVSWFLVFLLGCDLAFFFFALFYRFGVFNPSFLANAFGKSGYYQEQNEIAETRLAECFQRAGLPEDFLTFSVFKDAFERNMRNQVYGRQDTVPELTGLSIADEIGIRLDEMGDDERSLQAEGGILRLSSEIGDAFHETGKVAGVSVWQEAKAALEQVFPMMVMAFMVLLAVGCVFLFFLQKRKKKFFLLLGIALAAGSALYMVFCGIFLLGMGSDGGSSMLLGNENVLKLYRESVLTAGLSIGAVGLIGAALAAGIGKFWRQPTGKTQSM